MNLLATTATIMHLDFIALVEFVDRYLKVSKPLDLGITNLHDDVIWKQAGRFRRAIGNDRIDLSTIKKITTGDTEKSPFSMSDLQAGELLLQFLRFGSGNPGSHQIQRASDRDCR